MGGGGTTTVQQQSPAQLPEEAKPGYIAGRGWLEEQLRNPPVYQGKRVADVNALQTGAAAQTASRLGTPATGAGGKGSMGGGGGGTPLAGAPAGWTTGANGMVYDPSGNPSLAAGYMMGPNGQPMRDPSAQLEYGGGGMPYGNDAFVRSAPIGGIPGGTGAGGPTGTQYSADVQAQRTLSDQYLMGPSMQAAVASASEPLYQQFTRQVLPELRGSAIRSGHGGTVAGGDWSSRMNEAQANVTDEFAGQLGRSVVAPLISAERKNQIEALGYAPKSMATELSRIGALQGAGDYLRGFEQEIIGAEREKFEEPLARQGSAATALTNAPWSGGSMYSQAKETPGAMGIAQGVGSLALMAKALSKMS